MTRYRYKANLNVWVLEFIKSGTPRATMMMPQKLVPKSTLPPGDT